MAQSKSTDLGAALRGLIMASAVIFLLMLTIVWLTNRHFEGKKEAEGPPPPAAVAPAAAAQGAAAPPGSPVTPPIPVSPEAAAGKPGVAPPPPPPAPLTSQGRRYPIAVAPFWLVFRGGIRRRGGLKPTTNGADAYS